MKKIALLLSVSLATILSACSSVSPLGSKVSLLASKVVVVSQESRLLEGCEQLGPVTATASGWTKWDEDQTNQQARNNLREEAYTKYGADTVVVLIIDNHNTSATAEGMAYKCRQ